MAAELPKTVIRIVLISDADGRTQGLSVGAYLANYDPEGDVCNGVGIWTRDPVQAMTFSYRGRRSRLLPSRPAEPLAPARRPQPPARDVHCGVLVARHERGPGPPGRGLKPWQQNCPIVPRIVPQRSSAKIALGL